jgi:hypothetical protein
LPAADDDDDGADAGPLPGAGEPSRLAIRSGVVGGELGSVGRVALIGAPDADGVGWAAEDDDAIAGAMCAR